MVGRELLRSLADARCVPTRHCLVAPSAVRSRRRGSSIASCALRTLEQELRGPALRRCLLLPRHDAACRRFASRPSAPSTTTWCCSFARFAQSAGAKTLVAVSAAGAAPEARNFYLRVKGETELALMALRFRSLHLMQPSLLLGARREWRPAEACARAADAAVQSLAARALRAMAGDPGEHGGRGDVRGRRARGAGRLSPHLARL